jgi:hypothetical protein
MGAHGKASAAIPIAGWETKRVRTISAIECIVASLPPGRCVILVPAGVASELHAAGHDRKPIETEVTIPPTAIATP